MFFKRKEEQPVASASQDNDSLKPIVYYYSILIFCVLYTTVFAALEV